MFSRGLGVLQDYDKAISYYKKSAKYGYRRCAILISIAYGHKVSNDSQSNEIYEHSKQSYAWIKIAKALPDTDVEDANYISRLINYFEHDKGFKPCLQQANLIAKKICATIPKCIQ